MGGKDQNKAVLKTIRSQITVALIALSTLAVLIAASLAAVVSTTALTEEVGQRFTLIAQEAYHIINARMNRALMRERRSVRRFSVTGNSPALSSSRDDSIRIRRSIHARKRASADRLRWSLSCIEPGGNGVSN